MVWPVILNGNSLERVFCLMCSCRLVFVFPFCLCVNIRKHNNHVITEVQSLLRKNKGLPEIFVSKTQAVPLSVSSVTYLFLLRRVWEQIGSGAGSEDWLLQAYRSSLFQFQFNPQNIAWKCHVLRASEDIKRCKESVEGSIAVMSLCIYRGKRSG